MSNDHTKETEQNKVQEANNEANLSSEQDLSHTEDEIDQVRETNESDEIPQRDATNYPGKVIPDEHPPQIEADSELTKEYDPDSTYLDLIHLKITSLEALNLLKFQKLESLCLRQNLLTSISAIKDLPADTVEELDFYDNRIDHITSSMTRFKNLVNLDLSFNNIKNIKNLDTLVKLENLYFVQNRIKVIKNLEGLQSLKNLELGGNKIEEISETMRSLPNLEQLWLGKNKISRLMNLDKLANLRVLSIQANRITKIEGLEGMVNLEELYLSHNGISKIENLDNNKNLKVLDVTSNRISKLENLSHLTQLTDFWCSYNQVSSFEEIGKELGKLPELDTVYFEGNPVQSSNPTAYRRKLRLYLGPSLTKIDATYVQG